MADWGLLAGLGEGMKTFGNAWSDKSTAELKERLAKEREERAEQREIAKEARLRKQEESTPAEHRIERDSDGATWRVPYNKFGQPLGERTLASAEDIKNYNFEDKKRQVSLDKLVTDAQYAKEKHEADIKYRGALTEAADARAYRSMNPVPRTSSGRSGSSRTSLDEVDDVPNSSDEINAMIAENSNLFKAHDIKNDEAYRVTEQVIKTAREKGLDPVDLLNKMLPAYIDRNRGSKPATKPGVVKLGTPSR